MRAPGNRATENMKREFVLLHFLRQSFTKYWIYSWYFFLSLDDKNYSFYTIPLDGFFGRWRARPDFIFFKWILLVNFNFPQVCVGSCQLHSHSFIKTSNFTFHNLEETQAWHHLNYNPKRNPKSELWRTQKSKIVTTEISSDLDFPVAPFAFSGATLCKLCERIILFCPAYLSDLI